MTSARSQGFTLTEVMITVVIVSILAAIAVPSYQSYRLRVDRATGKDCLVDVQRRMEGHYTRNNQYTEDLADLGLTTADGAYSCGNEGPLYEVTASVEEGTNLSCCYQLTATAVGRQEKDGNLRVRYYSARSQPPSGANPQPVTVREREVDGNIEDWN